MQDSLTFAGMFPSTQTVAHLGPWPKQQPLFWAHEPCDMYFGENVNRCGPLVFDLDWARGCLFVRIGQQPVHAYSERECDNDHCEDHWPSTVGANVVV